MATNKEYIQYIVESTEELSNDISYKKMFGDYMLYYKSIPVILACDDMAYVRMFPSILELFDEDSEKAYPYDGASLHYVLDSDDHDLLKDVIRKVYKYRIENKK